MAKKKTGGIIGFLNGTKGQRFFNFAYSIGAAIVIWGALFKILHIQGGNTLLSIGMGTEIAMFVLTAFDRPPKEYAWEDVFPALDPERVSTTDTVGVQVYPQGGYVGSGGYVGGGDFSGLSGQGDGGGNTNFSGSTQVSGGFGGGVPMGGAVGGPIHPSMIYSGNDFEDEGYIGVPDEIDSGEEVEETVLQPKGRKGLAKGGTMNINVGDVQLTDVDTASLQESIAKMSVAADQLSHMAELTAATQDYLEGLSGIASQMAELKKTTAELNEASHILLDSYRTISDNSENISENSTGYVESMADLNRNIGGLNTIYEIQLKSISSQLESIDRVNRGLKDIRDMYEKSARQSSRYCEETEKMARYMKQLNSVYEKMITAMSIGMYNPMMGAAAAGAQTAQNVEATEAYDPYDETPSIEDNNEENA